MALFSNQDIYKTYQDLLGQGLTHDQIVAASERNPNIGLSGDKINAALAQYQSSGAQAGNVGSNVNSPGVVVIQDQDIPKIGSPAENLKAGLINSGFNQADIERNFNPEGDTLSVGRARTIYSPNDIIDPFSTRYPGIATSDTFRPAPTPAASQQNMTGAQGAVAASGALPAPVTDQQIFDVGKSLLQQGYDPQTILNRLASQTTATQDQINKAAGWLATSGFTVTTPSSYPGVAGSTFGPVTGAATTNIPEPPSEQTFVSKTGYVDPEQESARARADAASFYAMRDLGSQANLTNQDIINLGRTLLQGGADPQSVLNRLAQNPGVTRDTLQSAYNALTASGYTGLTMPGAKSTTMPVTSRATADTGAGTAGAATTGATTGAATGALPVQGATLTDQLLNAFMQGQKTGNYGTFQSLLRQSKASASDIAAMFPQLSEQNVMDFAKQYGLSLEAPSRVNLVGSMRDVPAEAASSLNLAKQLVTSMGPGYESLLSDPKLLQQMREAAPADYRQLLLGGFNAAQRTGDFTKFNKMLADRDVSETELRTMFPNITNAAIDEFKKRGLKFSALPDWMENQNLIKDQSVAEQIASKWKQEYGRDISPDDLKIVASQIGSMPSQADAKTVIGNIKNTPLLKSQEFLNAQRRGETFIPGLLTLQQAGLADLVGGFEGGQPARYDWNAIANSKDPRGAIIASNRQLAAMADQTLAKDYPQYAKIVGTVSGIPLVQRQTQKGDTYLTLGGASITDPKSLSKAIYQLGLTSDDLNKFADLADKSGTRYKPGTVYAGSDAGVDLRDIAAGGLGTRFNPFNDPYVASKGTGAVERQNEFQYYAGQLGLARNPAITGKTGYEIPSPQDIRPIYDREGKIQNYAVISGGGVRYFSSPAEAESQGYRNVIDLTGRAPMASYGQQTYRPGEKIISPTLPTINLRRLPGALPVGPKGPGG